MFENGFADEYLKMVKESVSFVFNIELGYRIAWFWAQFIFTMYLGSFKHVDQNFTYSGHSQDHIQIHFMVWFHQLEYVISMVQSILKKKLDFMWTYLWRSDENGPWNQSSQPLATFLISRDLWGLVVIGWKPEILMVYTYDMCSISYGFGCWLRQIKWFWLARFWYQKKSNLVHEEYDCSDHSNRLQWILYDDSRWLIEVGEFLEWTTSSYGVIWFLGHSILCFWSLTCDKPSPDDIFR